MALNVLIVQPKIKYSSIFYHFMIRVKYQNMVKLFTILCLQLLQQQHLVQPNIRTFEMCSIGKHHNENKTKVRTIFHSNIASIGKYIRKI